MTKKEERYYLYLNGKLYGSGPKEYIIELIKDYVVYAELYGRKEVDFKVIKGKHGILEGR